MNVLFIGASKNIGYFAAQRLLAKGANGTFLLRNPKVFDTDEEIQKYVKSGKAHLVKGDGLVLEDVRAAWTAAASHGPVDLVLFTLGGTPRFVLTKGFVIDPPDLVTRSVLHMLEVLPRDGTPLPKFVALTSRALTREGIPRLPLIERPMYKYALHIPHVDKLGVERILAHAAGWKWEDGATQTVPADFESRLPPAGFLAQSGVLVVRPALLTDGACKADEKKGSKPPYRFGEEDFASCYTVSRKDTAHFIVEEALANWSNWSNKKVHVGY